MDAEGCESDGTSSAQRERERERERAVGRLCSQQCQYEDYATSHCSCAGNLGNSIAGFVDPEIMGATVLVCHII